VTSDHVVEIETRHPETGVEQVASCSCGWESSPTSGRHAAEYVDAARDAHRRLVDSAGEPVRRVFHGTTREAANAIVRDLRLCACYATPDVTIAYRYSVDRGHGDPVVVQFVAPVLAFDAQGRSSDGYLFADHGTKVLEARILLDSDPRLIAARAATPDPDADPFAAVRDAAAEALFRSIDPD
jgi:hypothetical protein